MCWTILACGRPTAPRATAWRMSGLNSGATVGRHRTGPFYTSHQTVVKARSRMCDFSGPRLTLRSVRTFTVLVGEKFRRSVPTGEEVSVDERPDTGVEGRQRRPLTAVIMLSCSLSEERSAVLLIGILETIGQRATDLVAQLLLQLARPHEALAHSLPGRHHLARQVCLERDRLPSGR